MLVSSDRFALAVEVGRAVHDTVVGEGERGHAKLGRALHERVESVGAVQQAEFGVTMQMNEIAAVAHAS